MLTFSCRHALSYLLLGTNQQHPLPCHVLDPEVAGRPAIPAATPANHFSWIMYLFFWLPILVRCHSACRIYCGQSTDGEEAVPRDLSGFAVRALTKNNTSFLIHNIHEFFWALLPHAGWGSLYSNSCVHGSSNTGWFMGWFSWGNNEQITPLGVIGGMIKDFSFVCDGSFYLANSLAGNSYKTGGGGWGNSVWRLPGLKPRHHRKEANCGGS